MANTTLGTNSAFIRVVNANMTSEQWKTCEKIPLKGELCIESDTLKMKMGDGTKAYAELGYMYLSKAEIQNLITTGAFDLKPATNELLGGVKIGANVNVAADGTISVAGGTLAQKGVVQLSSATDSDSEVLAATPKAVKAAYDLASGKANASHSHDEQYYPRVDVDKVLAGKAPTVHSHDDLYYKEAEIDEKVDALNASISSKQNKVTGGASTIVADNLTASKVLVSNEAGKVAVAEVSTSELAFLKGVTSAIQVQLDSKAAKSHSHTVANITDFPKFLAPDDIADWAKAPTKPTYTPAEIKAIATSEKGAKNGVATLDANGIIPTAQLPGFVDDVLEYPALADFPEKGETGKIYLDTKTNKAYRWSGTQYVEISASLALGTTSSTAFRGDYGQVAYAHSQTAHVTGIKGASEETYRTGQVNITPANIGASPSNHTHSYAGSASVGGAANSAVKLATARSITIAGAATAAAVNFDGSANVTLTVSKLNAASLYLNAGDTLILDGSGYFAA